VEGVVCFSQCVVVVEVQQTSYLLKSSELHLVHKRVQDGAIRPVQHIGMARQREEANVK
jgi:hypothetical protein